MFVLNGGAYAICAPIWGRITDKNWLPPMGVMSFGCIMVITAFLFIGPAHFIPVTLTLNICIGMLSLHGVGFAAQLVAGFSAAHRQAIANGFEDNIETYGLVSGLWTSTFALGAFVGPTLGGVMVQHLGFPLSTILVLVVELLVLLATLFFSFYNRRYNRYDKMTTGMFFRMILSLLPKISFFGEFHYLRKWR